MSFQYFLYLDLPILTVNIPEAIISEKLNKNDFIMVDIDSDVDPDDVYFSLVFIYGLEVVSTKSFHYT